MGILEYPWIITILQLMSGLNSGMPITRLGMPHWTQPFIGHWWKHKLQRVVKDYRAFLFYADLSGMAGWLSW